MRPVALVAGLWSIHFSIASASGASNSASSDLWAALQHATGFTDDELTYLAEELRELPAPSQKRLWQEKVRCGKGYCAPEATSRLVAALGEAGQLPSRVFELFPGDPLYNYWKESDRTAFHSWVNGQPAHEETIEALIPRGSTAGVWKDPSSQLHLESKGFDSKVVGPSGD